MGRELKRKNKKQNIQINEESESLETLELKKILKVFLFVLVLLVIAYLIVGIFVTKEIKLNWFNNKPQTEINANYILASETFNQKEETYYVYCYDFNDYNTSIESTIVNKLSDRIYRVDTSSAFNSHYVEANSNQNAQNKDELKINGLTLIKIENGANAGYYEGEDAINDFLNK